MPKSLFIKITIILVVVLVIAGGGYAGWLVFEKIKKDGKQIEQDLLNGKEMKLTPTATPLSESFKSETSEVDTSNWMIYKNNKLGFRLSYPDNLILDEKNIEGKFKISFWFPDDFKKYQDKTGMSIPLFSLTAEEVKELSFENWFQRAFGESIDSSPYFINRMNINRALAYRVIGPNEMPPRMLHIYFYQERILIDIMTTAGNDIRFASPFERMISTFQFIK